MGNLFAWHCLSLPVMPSLHFSHVFHVGRQSAPVCPTWFQFTRRQPGIKVAAKGRIASSENAGNAGLVAAAAGFGREGRKKPDLKANPWSVGTDGSKIELPLCDRPDEGAERELRKVDFKSL